ncbi:MAG: N-acetylmuramoyl-L-alanine amidase [Planctomycetes bacterium]|nr:N-acetylmuramoyl-L-alanine amidase [Planctomycetota bacterium]
MSTLKRAFWLAAASVFLAAVAMLAGLSPWSWPDPPATEEREAPSALRSPLPEALEKHVTTERRLAIPDRGALTPTAIVVHSTSGLSLMETLAALEYRAMGVHLLVDADGRTYRLVDLDRRVRAARGFDDVALHVSVVGGVDEELLKNEAQLESAARVVRVAADHFGIPKTNADVVSRRGIFSHQQAKYRWGGFRRGERKDRVEPGEAFMRELLRRAGGVFVEEKDWKGRAEEGWALAWEGGDLSTRGALTKGRGLTPTPPPALRSVEVVEARRMKYVDRGTIEPRGIVLHFTATETYDEAIEAFERRRLGPTITVDVDGRAYQVVDRLEDKVVAAGGTNDHCVQIEIVGLGESVLLENSAQTKKVIEVISELCEKYRIPKTNRDIESRRGVYSHGQAKKRWGRSAWLWGTDFDPGETYMKRVIEGAGGQYVEEKDWPGRTSDEWFILYDEWLP